MVRVEEYYARKGRGVCVECESVVDEFVRCRRCLDRRAHKKALERRRKRGLDYMPRPGSPLYSADAPSKSIMDAYHERNRQLRYRRDSL